MAAIPKQRLILYIVIGVIAIGFGIWFMIQAKGGQSHKLRVRTHQAARIADDLDGLLSKAARNTEGLAGGPELIARAQAAIGEFRTADNPNDSSVSEPLTAKYEEIRNMISELRKLKKAARTE
jgi:hypothetical protein